MRGRRLSKGEAYWRFERDADWLLVDYIDERFDLLKVDGALVSDTKHLKQPGFTGRYGAGLVQQPRLSGATTDLWRAGAELFFRRALSTFGPERIILHEGRWAPAFRATDGTVSPFNSYYAKLIAPHNDLLETYFAITKEIVPGISVVRVPDEVLFADPEHRWSKEPFHYVPAYYAAFLDTFHGMVQTRPVSASAAE